MDIPSEKVAKLRTISLLKLQAGSVSERNLLLQTCTEDGFFYLDLTHPSHSALQNDVESVFVLSKDLFNYPLDIKTLFDVDKVSDLKVNGYKPKGRNIATTGGKTDGFETWVLPRNGLLQLSDAPFPYPPLIASNLNALRRVVQELSSAANIILSSLSASLSLPGGQRLEDFQGLSRPSPDILRLLKYHADANTSCQPHVPHTDMGSLTFLFSHTPGLQVLPHGVSKEDKIQGQQGLPWQYVMPRPGHAVVNVGDCLSKMTNGLLKSALHRVGPIEGHPMDERYSIAYLMRPEDHTVLRALDSPLIPPPVPGQEDDPITSGEWVRRKFKALRGQHDNGSSFDQILTGGRGVLD
ncbi:oxidoreductase- 2OG-Fe(II) oxygenase family [Apiospora phragmitis]|uniref:Oxidoreductase- 2OG-Fe(II) oxygenase family n=1 Tax=Apiospora phragmitis TaxID=2905665 RepID=A0ABR1VG02_9PEZI